MAKIAEILNNVVSDSGVEISSLQPLLTNPVTGTGTTNYIPKFTGTSAIGNSDLITDGSGNLAIAQGNAPTQALNIYRAGSTQTVMAAGNSNTGLNGTYFGVDPNGNGIFNTTGAFANIFSTNGSERMRITSGGNVLVGTTTDAGYKLDVNGSVKAVGSFNGFQSGTQNLLIDWSAESQVTTLTATNLFFGTNAERRMTITSAGLVGIGTSSPGSNLTIQQASTSATLGIRHTASGNGYGWRFATTGTTTNDLIFSNEFNGSFTERMRLDANGRLGIGTSSPTYSVDVVGYMRTSLGLIGSSGLTMYGDASSATGMFLNTSGNLGLGVTPSAWSSSRKAFEFGNVGKSISGGGNVTEITLGGNAYDAAGGWTYANTAQATAYQQYNGLHTWLTAPSGTAGNAISWTQAMTLDASGRLGIGTTSPDVYGVHAYNASNSVYFKSVSGSTTTLYGSATALGVGLLGTFSNSDLTIYTNSSEKMRITSGGNVGIGTSSPANKLQIGSVGSTGFGGNDIAIGNGSQVMTFYQSATISTWYTNTSFSLMPSGVGAVGNVGIGTTSPSNRLTVSGNADITGNVGIGTTSPNRKLIVYDTDANVPTIGLRTDGSGTASTDGFDIQFASNNTFLYNRENGYMAFGTNDTERMRITSGGNVGIGTTSPASLLNLSNTNPVITLTRSDNASTPSGAINFSSISTVRWQIGTNQAVGGGFEINEGNSTNNRFYMAPGGATIFSSNVQASYFRAYSGGVYSEYIYDGMYSTGTDQYIYTAGGYNTRFYTNSAERMRITSGGNLLVGTTTDAGYKLDVNGVIHNNAAVFVSQGVQGNASGFTFSGLGSNYGRIYEAANDRWALGYSASYGGASTAVLNWNSSGNLGLGVTPSAWESGFNVFQIGNTGVLANNTSDLRTILNSNAFNNTSGNTTYLANGFATSYMQISGTHRWYTAPSGTAGNAITFTQAMTLDASGRLGIGVTNPSGLLQLNGSIATSGDAATFTIKQSSTTYTNGIYLERGGERNGYYMYIGGGLDALTFRRNYFGTQSDVMSLTRDGNVGIGTTSPAGQFEVYTDVYRRLYTSNIDAYTIRFVLGANSYIQQDAANEELRISQQYGSGKITFYTGATNSERMRITSGGNVLIGTTTDAGYKMEVAGSTRISSSGGVELSLRSASSNPQYIAFSESGVADRWVFGVAGGSGDLQFRSGATNISNGSERMRITSGGNVGIGTSSPVAKLDLYGGGSDVEMAISTTAGYGYTQLRFGASAFVPANSFGIGNGITGGGIFLRANATGDIRMGGGTTEWMRITSGGIVGIGTSSPDASTMLQVQTSNSCSVRIVSSALSGGDLYITSVNGGSESRIDKQGTAGPLTFYNNGSERMRITSSGNTELTGSIKTGAPSGGTAAAWKLGSRISNTCGLPATYADFAGSFMNTNKVIEIEIGGVTVYVPTVTPGWC